MESDDRRARPHLAGLALEAPQVDLGVILRPGTWVRLRGGEGYCMPWEVVGVVTEVDADSMRAYVQFADGEPYWIPIVDLMLLSA